MRTPRIAATAFLLLVTMLGVSYAQPVPPPGLRAVQHGSEMAGSGTTAAPLTLTHACGTNEILKWNGSAWICAGLASGSVSGTGTSGKIARWSGVSTIADGSAQDDGSRILVADFRGTTISPTAIGGTVPDWAPTSLSTATTIRVDSSSTITLSGLTGGAAGRIIILHYIGAHTLNLTNQDAGSTAANRFITGSGGTIALTQDQNAWLSYDGTSSRWRVVSSGVATGDITDVVAGTGLTGGATSGSATLTLNMAGASCSAGSFISALSATGTGTCTAEPGDITGVTAGTGLSGGGTSGAVSLAVNITGGTCTAGDFVSAVSATGVATCGTPSGSGDITDVIAGNGLTGGATSGAATVDVGAGTNITVNANDIALSTNVAVGGTLSVASGATTVSDFRGSTISTSTTGPFTDWNPSGLSGATYIRDTTTTTPSVSGLSGGSAGRIIFVTNIGSSTLTFTNQDASSTAANRFIIGNGLASVTLQVDQSIGFIYDGTTSRWRTLSYPYTHSGNFTQTGNSIELSSSVIFPGSVSTINGTLTVGQTVGIVSNPSSISGTVNDWTPSGGLFGNALIVRISTSGTTTLTGLTGGTSGRVLWLENSSASNVSLTNNDAGSTASNRFFTGGSTVTVAPDKMVGLIYDPTSSRWRVFADPSGGGSGVTSIATTSPISGGTITTTGTISLAACSTNQIYKYNGSSWACSSDNDTVYTAGTNMALAGNAFSVASSVSLTGSLATGTYVDASGGVYAGGASSDTVDMIDGSVNFGYSTNGAFTGKINDKGYQDGTTQFRNVEVRDGKGATIATYTGSSKDVTFANTVEVNGNTTLGDASTDVTTVNGKISAGAGPASGRTIEAANVQTAQTGTVDVIWGSSGGTFNTTSSGITTSGVKGQATATRSSGANTLQTIGVLGSSTSGGQETYGVASEGNFIVANSIGSGAGTNPAFSVTTSGSNNGQTIVWGRLLDAGTAPTISSCGTTPSVSGGSHGFHITAGSGTATSCTATFAVAFSLEPTCIATSTNTAYYVFISAISASAITLTASGTQNMAGNKIEVVCVGDI